MAKVVTHFPDKGPTNGRNHPWDKWMDGRIWELRQGKDFKPKPTSFSQQVYMKARQLKVKARTAVRGNRVYVQAVKIAPGKGKRN